MDAYIDLALLPDEDFPAHILLNALLAKLHRVLVTLGENRIGISFPQWRQGDYPTLGTVLRLHGTEPSLQALMQQAWLRGMRDHLNIQGPQPIPAVQGWLKVQRHHASSATNMRRRAMRRHGYSEAEAKARIPDSASDRLNLPFTTQRSTSTGQTYRLFIRQTEAASATPPHFNSHGLSTGGTVPKF